MENKDTGTLLKKAVFAVLFYAVNILLTYYALEEPPADKFVSAGLLWLFAAFAATFILVLFSQLGYRHIGISLLVVAAYYFLFPKNYADGHFSHFDETFESLCIFFIFMLECGAFALAHAFHKNAQQARTVERSVGDPKYAPFARQGESKARQCMNMLYNQNAVAALSQFCAYTVKFGAESTLVQLTSAIERLRLMYDYQLESMTCTVRLDTNGNVVFFACCPRYCAQMRDGRRLTVEIYCNRIWQKHREFEGVVQITLTDCQSGEMMNVGSTVLPYEDC